MKMIEDVDSVVKGCGLTRQDGKNILIKFYQLSGYVDRHNFFSFIGAMDLYKYFPDIVEIIDKEYMEGATECAFKNSFLCGFEYDSFGNQGPTRKVGWGDITIEEFANIVNGYPDYRDDTRFLKSEIILEQEEWLNCKTCEEKDEYISRRWAERKSVELELIGRGKRIKEEIEFKKKYDEVNGSRWKFSPFGRPQRGPW